MVFRGWRSRKEDKSGAGAAIPAGLLIGLGLGFLFNNIPGWLFIGLGAGFLVLLILKMLGK